MDTAEPIPGSTTVKSGYDRSLFRWKCLTCRREQYARGYPQGAVIPCFYCHPVNVKNVK